jgi:hypothetical protein
VKKVEDPAKRGGAVQLITNNEPDTQNLRGFWVNIGYWLLAY